MPAPPPWLLRLESRRAEFPDDDSFATLLRAALAGDPAGGFDRWAISADEVWLVADPLDRPRRAQGWKLHLAATVGSASEVLTRSLPILRAWRCHFKLARSPRQLEILNGLNCPEGLSGKFLTVYPDDDVAAVALAEALDAATTGLDGPRILSDRPLRPGSLVHLRYGAFVERAAFTPFGVLRPVIRRPDGAFEEDRRLGRFAPPVWAPDPFAAVPAVAPPATRPDGAGATGARPSGARGGPRIGDYEVEAAIKRANRGGTYRARSPRHGTEVILKEARPHVATDRHGRDACERLRHEAAILRDATARPDPLPAPRPLDLFTHGGHLFLVREYLAGTPLRSYVRRRTAAGDILPERELRALAGALVDLLARFHAAGLLVRDFNPNNVIVRDGVGDPARAPVLALVDLELAHDPAGATPPFRGATLAYASPAQEADQPPTVADDLYALGATLAYVATSADPFFLPDDAGGRTLHDRLAARLALHQTPAWASELILGCLAPAPEARPTLVEASARIAAADRTPGATLPLPAPSLPSRRQLVAAVEGVVAYLAAARGAGRRGHRWPTTDYGSATDPRCLAHGAAGIGLFLLQAHRHTPSETVAALLDEAIAAMATPPVVEGPLPAGLAYGEAGVAWFLAEAGERLGRPDLVGQAAACLGGLPPIGESPDLMTGTAGLGYAALRVALAGGDVGLEGRVAAATRTLEAAARSAPQGRVWPIPAHFATDGVGKSYPGFAYGLAGIATFLLHAAAVTERAEASALGREALVTLLSWRQERDGLRRWPTSSHAIAGSPCWLKGVAGIGAALVRAARLTGDPLLREAALDCWRMLRPVPRHGPLTQLNGLAGVGELCLDLADLLGLEEARTAAWEIGRTIYEARLDRRRDGFGLTFPDEEGLAGADFLTGTTGIAAFLLRLAEGGSRWLFFDAQLSDSILPWRELTPAVAPPAA